MDQSYHSSRSSTQDMNKYWIPHKDIHKKVIMTHIQFYLGSEATARSYTKDGEDGFLITTPGACLTDDQIDDICIKSMEMWERQAAARMLAADGTSSPSSSAAHKAPLKRPLHQPVVIARASSRRSGGSFGDGRGRRPSSHSHQSSSSSPSSHLHHSRHGYNHGHGQSHSYSPQQQHLPYPPQHQQRQLHPSQQLQQQPCYPQQHHFHQQPSSAHSQHMAYPNHAVWAPLSPAQDSLRADCERPF